jgi:shikimate dehydrogenase
MEMAGANITVPHKERVMEFLDEVDEEAKALGAVNTVVNRDGRLIGYNTDGRGFIQSLKEDAGFEPSQKRVFVCGAGGAARAIVFSLVRAGARRVYLYDIDGHRCDRLVADVNSAAGREATRTAALDAAFIRGAELVVNATPLGMRPDDPMPMPDGSFRAGQVVYDIIYNPAVTSTMDAARRAGAKAVNGLGMLLYQGVLAFWHWTGTMPPAEVMRGALEDAGGRAVK